MANLSDDVKLAIVQALACFDSPQQVAEFVKQEFGLTLPRQQVAKYDPTKAAGHKLSQKLREIFAATRAAFLPELPKMPIAHQAYRLRTLQRQLEKAQDQGNSAMVLQILEQAAKEVGGMFTNRREVTGRNGAPVQVVPTTIELVAPAEAAAAYAKLMLG